MTFSTNLQRHLDVPIDALNRFDEFERDCAIGALPDGPDSSPEQIRAAAKAGNINARFVLQRAAEGDPIAQEWVG